MASNNSQVCLTHRVLNACHVASNKTFFSHRCFRGIFTGQIFRKNDPLTSKRTFAFFCLMSQVNCILFLHVSYSGNFLAPVHMSMKWFSRFSVLFFTDECSDSSFDLQHFLQSCVSSIQFKAERGLTKLQVVLQSPMAGSKDIQRENILVHHVTFSEKNSLTIIVN